MSKVLVDVMPKKAEDCIFHRTYLNRSAVECTLSSGICMLYGYGRCPYLTTYEQHNKDLRRAEIQSELGVVREIINSGVYTHNDLDKETFLTMELERLERED